MHSNAFNEFGTHFYVRHFSKGFDGNFEEESTCHHLCIVCFVFLISTMLSMLSILHIRCLHLFTCSIISFCIRQIDCFLLLFPFVCLFVCLFVCCLLTYVVVFLHISTCFKILFAFQNQSAARCFLWSDRGSDILSPGMASVMVLSCWPRCSLQPIPQQRTAHFKWSYWRATAHAADPWFRNVSSWSRTLLVSSGNRVSADWSVDAVTTSHSHLFWIDFDALPWAGYCFLAFGATLAEQ